jgi:RNA polymerase sigma-70 factor (ECF subfamily)
MSPTIHHFNNKIAQLRPTIKRLVAKRLRDGDSVEDVVQEVMLKLWKHGYLPNNMAALFKYVSSTCRFAVYDFLRAEKKRDIGLEQLRLQRMNEEPRIDSDMVRFIDTQIDLEKIMEKLSDTQRSTLWLHMRGYPYSAIAEEQNVPIGTVRSRLAKLRKELTNV